MSYRSLSFADAQGMLEGRGNVIFGVTDGGEGDISLRQVGRDRG